MMHIAIRGVAFALTLGALTVLRIEAQEVEPPAARDTVVVQDTKSAPDSTIITQVGAVPTGTPSVAPGDPLEDRLRTADLLRPSGSRGWMIRSASSTAAPLDGSPSALRAGLSLPRAQFAWNSALPFPERDGALWAGRGLNVRVGAGVRAEYGPVRLFLLPELVYSQNRGFQTISGPAARSAFLPPWRRHEQSADLPLRFGDEPVLAVHPGQSSLSVALGSVETGAATENQWWGPGIRNAIVMSNNAPGFPHAFVRTARPLQTPVGMVEGRWIVGALTESLHFDTLSSNDHRSLSGVAVAITPRGNRGLTLGLSRVVYEPLSDLSAALVHAADVATRWDQNGRGGEDPSEQILSLFGRWIFPRDGLELYGEWARTEVPKNLRDFLYAPARSQGYTLGLQWARPFESGRALRLQSELTYLEKADPPTRSFYTSLRVPQGYTHRGQVIGAAIGPGASSQWLALDYLALAWQAGIFAGRVRWDNDAYYTTANPTLLGHDVSVFGGVRGTGYYRYALVSAELTFGMRYNYLFQNEGIGFDQGESVDVSSTTLRFSVYPASAPPRIRPPPAPPPPAPAPTGPAPTSVPEPAAPDPERSARPAPAGAAS